ncbi:hypothetical protein ABI582_16110 [Pseudomonas sp. SAS7]|uniref:hypothetical protein n=1 Tax=Pseudomonas sp. SAS7 TaxID=3156487 RepID=UPI003F9B8CDE
MFKIFGYDKSLVIGVKQTGLDALSIMVAAAIGALLAWVTYGREVWLAFVAYTIAIVVMVMGLWVSKKRGNGKTSYMINLLVVSLLCIMATDNLTHCLAKALTYLYTGQDVPAFVTDKSSGGELWSDIVWTIVPLVCVTLANRWMNAHQTRGSVGVA